MIYFRVLFWAKVLDNALSTTKTIMIQRSRWILAGIAVIVSDFIYYWITKRVVSADGELAMLIVSVAGGIGCSLACLVSDKLSKDRTYVDVIMSDNLEAMKVFRDFPAEHHISNVAADTYTRDWNDKLLNLFAGITSGDPDDEINTGIGGLGEFGNCCENTSGLLLLFLFCCMKICHESL